MEKLTVHRIKLDFSHDRAVIEIGTLVKKIIEEMNENYPDWTHTVEKELTAITDEYINITISSKERRNIQVFW